MLQYDRNGLSIQETDEGFNIAFQNGWADLPCDLHAGLVVNSTITGIFNYDGCLYIALQRNEKETKHRLMKISTGQDGTIRYDTMGLQESTYNNIIEALKNCISREE